MAAPKYETLEFRNQRPRWGDVCFNLAGGDEHRHGGESPTA